MSIRNPSVVIACPPGTLNAESASRFQQQLVSAIRDSCGRELIVDMSAVDSLDNAGLVSFMSTLNAARVQSKRLSICSAPPSVRIVFELTQLDRVFTMIEPEPIAIAA